MRYDNVISLCATIGSEQKDLSDLTREQVIAVFTSRINDLFDHDEFHAVYDLADQVETEGGAVMSEQEFYDRLREAFEGTNVTFDHMDDLGDYIAERERCVSFFGVETKEVES